MIDFRDSVPVQLVGLTDDFEISAYTANFDSFDLFCDSTERKLLDDNQWGRGNRPAIHLTWWDTIEYCNWLSQQVGLAVAYDSAGNLLDATGTPTRDITQIEKHTPIFSEMVEVKPGSFSMGDEVVDLLEAYIAMAVHTADFTYGFDIAGYL